MNQCEESTNSPKQFRAWVQAAECSEWRPLKVFGAAWRIIGPNGETHEPDTSYVKGSNDRAIIVTASDLISRLPRGSTFHFITSLESVWGAFSHGWIEKWKAEGFKDRDEWGEFDRMVCNMELQVSAGPPNADDRAILEALKRKARNQPPKPKAEPGDPPQGFTPPDNTDWLFRRAIDRND
jgi:hypothetical protein